MDDYTFAEAVQLFTEHSRSQWNHTAMLAFYICEVNRDPKKGRKMKLQDFNPWSSKQPSLSNRITADNIRLLKRMIQ